eukprot:Pgem_evm1s13270
MQEQSLRQRIPKELDELKDVQEHSQKNITAHEKENKEQNSNDELKERNTESTAIIKKSIEELELMLT